MPGPDDITGAGGGATPSPERQSYVSSRSGNGASDPAASAASMPFFAKRGAGDLGWLVVDRDCLAAWAASSSGDGEVETFLEGGSGVPWPLAADDRIKRFDVVKTVVGALGDRDPGSLPRVVMLGGGCGEGKTTAMRQIVAQWVEKGRAARAALVREGSIGRADNVLATLRKVKNAADRQGARWLVAIDNARPVQEVFELAEALYEQNRHDVDILFVCSHIAWPQDQRWPPQAPKKACFELVCHDFAGLSWSDAGVVVDGWVASGLTLAKDCDNEVSAWYNAAEVGASRFTDFKGESIKGSLLGALLLKRPDRGAAQRLTRMVKRLSDEPGGKMGTIPLVYGLGVVAAAHASGFPAFTQSFLCRCLCLADQCREEGEAPRIVERLLYEAVVIEKTDGLLATRHHAIAARLAVECALSFGRTEKEAFLGDIIRFADDPTPTPPYPLYEGPRRQLLALAARRHLRRNAVADAAICCRNCLSDWPREGRNVEDALSWDTAGDALRSLREVVRRSGPASERHIALIDTWITAVEAGPPPRTTLTDRTFNHAMATIIDSVIDRRRRTAIETGRREIPPDRSQGYRFSKLFGLILRPPETESRTRRWRATGFDLS